MSKASPISSNVRPPTLTFEPSLWGDTFLTFSIDHQAQQKYAEEIEALKKEAKGMLMAETTLLKQMILIDMLEHLGLAYHFEIEIQEILIKIFEARHNNFDLFATALRFRLLRHHQFHISCNVFNKFVDKEGRFEESLRHDGEGLLSLYEAAHVRFHSEKILQEAATFASHYLRFMEGELESPLKEKVVRALQHSFHRDVRIFHTRAFISIYENDYLRDEIILKLAKFNFNLMQNFYKRELSELTRWWNKFDLKTKLPYVRDRIVEAYIWGIACHYEPQYSLVRIGVVKCLMVATVMDDTFDNYATLDEAQLFTEILDTWSVDGIDKLPNYMRIVYLFIMSVFEDYKHEAVKQGMEFAVPHFKQTVQQLGRAYAKELKWIVERNMPSFEDYAKNSEISSCIYIMFTGSMLGLKSVTQETIDWMKSDSKFAIATAMIGRYSNDIGSSERENKGGKMLTAVDCYMEQYNLTKQETLSKFAELIEDAWMDVNEEWVATTRVPKETTVQLLNFARHCDACYNKNNVDGYTDPKILASHVVAIFIDPIVI